MADYDLITNDLLAAANALPLRVGLGSQAMPHDLPADAILIDDALRRTAPGWQLNLPRLARQIELVLAVGPADSERAHITQPDPALLEHLDAVQHEVLRTRASASFSTLAGLTLSEPVCSAKEIDRGCVVLLARAFERVFRDRQLSAQTKTLVAPLQLPLVRAALLDRSFFIDAEHPARTFFGTVLEAVAGQSDDEADAALSRVVETCTRTLLHSTGEPNALFNAMQTRFARWLEARARERSARLAPMIHEQTGAEALAFAEAEVQRRLMRRFELADIDATLAEFLRGPWRLALVRRCLARDADSHAWQRALETTDTLVWSVLPKANSLERGEMLRTLPALVKCVNDELDAIGWSGDARRDFLHYLMDAHANVARLPPRLSAKRLASAGGLRDGDTRPGDPSSSTVLDIVRLPEVDAPRAGDWYVFQREGSETLSRLCLFWISPMRTRLVLAHHDGFHQCAFNASEMLALLHAGTLQRMEASRLIESALAA